MSKVLVFDLEICLDPETNGGWGAARRGDCGFSLGCIYDSTTQRPYIYWEHEIDRCLEHLNMADRLITFNGQDFDLPIVEALTGRQVEVPIHNDLLKIVMKASKTRSGYSLNALGERCLKRSKVAPSGKSAIGWYQTGDWSNLVGYCIGDVLLTRDLASYMALHGHVITPGGETLTVELDMPELL